MAKGINKKSINFRYNIITIFTYLIGIILIVQLFNLQIVHGAKYREESNTRLTRESTLEATRGEILDRSGNVLVSSSQKFNLELYKSKIDTNALNDSILKIIQVLEKYNVKYCLYGHLHGKSHINVFDGIYNNVNYKMVSCDYTGFKLIKII